MEDRKRDGERKRRGREGEGVKRAMTSSSSNVAGERASSGCCKQGAGRTSIFTLAMVSKLI